MEISPNDRPTVAFQEDDQLPERKRAPQAAILAIALAILVAGGWWLSRSMEPAPEEEVVSTLPPVEISEPEPVIDTEPEIQTPAVEAPVEVDQPKITLPALDDSDPFIREQLSLLNISNTFQNWLQSDNLVRRAVVVTDGLSRGVMLQKFIPVSGPESKFAARKDGQQYWIDAKNYQRYDSLVNTLTAIEPEKLVNSVKLLKPLLDNAFAEQGYSDRSFDDALLKAIDQMLLTPRFDEPPELKLESVYFKYKDPSLEQLTPVQKQLIRSGPDNTLKIQSYLQQLKEELTKKN